MRKIFFVIIVIFVISPLTTSAYDYDVSGYGDSGDVTGEVETYGRDVEGTLETESGETIDFEGEFTGHGVIEGYGSDGNYYELEVE